MIQNIHRFCATAWGLIRALSTDDAYDKYLLHHAAAHADRPPLSRRAFYINQQKHKWTGVSRCC